jgi:hypothetical protein
MMNDIAHMIASIERLTFGRWNIVSSLRLGALVDLRSGHTSWGRDRKSRSVEAKSLQFSDIRLLNLLDGAIRCGYRCAPDRVADYHDASRYK